jgi:hypothetical protein
LFHFIGVYAKGSEPFSQPDGFLFRLLFSQTFLIGNLAFLSSDRLSFLFSQAFLSSERLSLVRSFRCR